MKLIRQLYRGICAAMAHPLVLAYRASQQAETIQADVVRWREMVGAPGHGIGFGDDVESALRAYLAVVPEFRNIFYYRLSAGGGWPATVGLVGRLLWRPLSSLELNCPSIGPGLVVAHGYGAVLTAERVGANCTIHQQVTVGWRDIVQNGHVRGLLGRPFSATTCSSELERRFLAESPSATMSSSAPMQW